MKFREEIRHALGGIEPLPDDWTTTAKVVGSRPRGVVKAEEGRQGDLVVG